MSPARDDLRRGWVERRGADERTTWIDLGARGLRGGYGAALAAWSIATVMILPLGILGLVAATWRDFGWLRPLCGIGGVIGACVALGPVAWIATQAYLRRERVQITPEAVAVEVWLGPRRRATHLGRPGEVALASEAVSDRPAAGVVLFDGVALALRGGGATATVGSGVVARADLDALEAALRAALARASLQDDARGHSAAAARTTAAANDASVDDPAHRTPTEDEARASSAADGAPGLDDERGCGQNPRGPGPDLTPTSAPPHAYALAARAAHAAQDLAAPLLHPTPYLICDLGVVLGSLFLSGYLAAHLPLLRLYPFLALAALGGLALRRHDPTYMAGLRRFRRRYDLRFDTAYVCTGGLIGVAAGFCFLAGRFYDPKALPSDLRPVVGIAIFVTFVAAGVASHVSLLRRAGGASADPALGPTPEPAPPSDRRPRRLWAETLAALTLLPLAFAHEQAAYLSLAGTARGLGPMALPIVWSTVCFVYLPVRLHYVVDEPDDPGNLRWCALTTVLLTLRGVFGVGV